MDARGAGRIDRGEPVVQRVRRRASSPLRSGAGADASSAGGPSNRPQSSAFRYSGVPPTNRTCLPRPSMSRQQRLRLLEPPGDAGRFPRIEHVDEMMRHVRALRRRRLGGADVHAAIQRHRVHRDDLGVQALGQLDAELRLARAGRTGQHQGVVKGGGSMAYEGRFLCASRLLCTTLGSSGCSCLILYRHAGDRSPARGSVHVFDTPKNLVQLAPPI